MPDWDDEGPASLPKRHEAARLSDGREGLGDDFAPPVPEGGRGLGESFQTQGSEDLGDTFADPTYADRHALGHAFADPNSLDDGRLGRAFAESNSSAKKHHTPVKEALSKPLRKAGRNGVLVWVVLTVIVVFLLILFLGWLPRHHRREETDALARQEQQAPEVDVTRVERAQSDGGLTVPGTTTPLEEAAVYARASGYLKARYVDIGDHVVKGQLLAVIEAPDLDQQVDQAREQVRQAQAQLAQQQTQLALTKVTVDRYRALVERGVFSRQDGDQQEANYQAQQANVSSATRNVDAFQANLRRVVALQSYERVTAPFTGVVTQRNVDTGSLINAQGASGGNAPIPAQTAGLMTSSTNQNAMSNTSGASGNANMLATPATGGSQGGPLFAIAKSDQLRILVSVPEGYAASVMPGTLAKIYFQELPDDVFYGNVTRNAGTIDQNTRTLLTELVIKNKNNVLLSGMYAVATFESPKGTPGPLVVSGDSIAIRNDRPTVAEITDNKVHLQPVVIGRDYGPVVEIVNGVHQGELIASSFSDAVEEGRTIRPHLDAAAQKKENDHPVSSQSMPPGGSTQYSNPAIVDANMQGKAQAKGGKSGAKKAGANTGSKP